MYQTRDRVNALKATPSRVRLTPCVDQLNGSETLLEVQGERVQVTLSVKMKQRYPIPANLLTRLSGASPKSSKEETPGLTGCVIRPR